MAKKSAKRKAELDKIREDYYNSIPESELNPNHKEDFEKLLSLAVKTQIKKKAKK